jgi:hypothetical protein
MAQFVESGRTPREYQPWYDAFLSASRDEQERLGVTMLGSAHPDALSSWLNDVSTGILPENAAKSLAEGEYRSVVRWSKQADEAFASSVRDAWIRVGLIWEHMLDAISMGLPSRVLVVFPTDALSPRSLGALLAVSAHARISAGHLDWTVAAAPGGVAPLLETGHREDRGLVLLRRKSDVWCFDADRCGLLLRNLLVDIGLGALADRVRVGVAGTEPVVIDRRDDEAAPIATSHVPVFGGSMSGFGLTEERCLPAVRAAYEGRSLASPLTGRPRQSGRRRRKRS